MARHLKHEIEFENVIIPADILCMILLIFASHI